MRPGRTLLLAIALVSPTLAGCFGSSGGLHTGGNRLVLEQRQVTDQTLLRAAASVDGGDGAAAFGTLVDRFRDEPQAAHQDIALWLAANALIESGKRVRAFYYLDQLMDEHVGSPLYFAAAHKQYEIADSYLDNRSDRNFFVFPVRRHAEAVEMLFRIQQRVPGAPLAEQALKRSGDFYYSNGDFDFAEDAYGVFIDRYPRSPDIPVVRLKQAFANVQQYGGPNYDPTPLLDAGTQLRQFSAEYPELAKQQKIPDVLDWIDDHLAKKLMRKADFYDRTGEDRASLLLMAEVTRQYPDTDHARSARRQLESGAAAVGVRPTTAPASEQEAQP